MTDQKEILFNKLIASAKETKELMHQLNAISEYRIASLVCSDIEGVSVIDDEEIHPIAMFAAKKPAFLKGRKDKRFYRAQGDGFLYKYTWED